MAWLEMSRTPNERPDGWQVGECLWTTRRKRDGSRWAFKETMLEIKRGDLIFHLAGGSREAVFTGFSIADGDGQEIDEGPFGQSELYRVPLRDYTPFEERLAWDKLRVVKKEELLTYFQDNKLNKNAKERLFYVLQAGRLQCLNGAYMSFLSDRLIQILFGFRTKKNATEVIIKTSAEVGSGLRSAAVRLGQQKFSENVKANFGGQCCFPGCPLSDPRFLVGAHIARWTDAAELRGRTDNGLCLCVLHDRAFEIGAFTFDQNLRVKIHKCDSNEEWVSQFLNPGARKRIKASKIVPSHEVLAHHWKRHDLDFG